MPPGPGPNPNPNPPFGSIASKIPPLPGPRPQIIRPLTREQWIERFEAMAQSLKDQFIEPERLAVLCEDTALQWDALEPKQRVALVGVMAHCRLKIEAILAGTEEGSIHDA